MDHFKITTHYSRVKKLNAKIDPKTVPEKITMPSPEVRELRARLILEEAIETIEGLGFDVELPDDYDRGLQPVTIEQVVFTPREEGPDMVGIADGCADLSVVTIGTLVASGIPDKRLLELVDNNNLDKFGPGGFLRDDGKWIKPPDHKPPDILGFLKREGWEPEA